MWSYLKSGGMDMSEEKQMETMPAERPAADIAERPAAEVMEKPAADIVEVPAAEDVPETAAEVVEKPAADVAEVPDPAEDVPETESLPAETREEVYIESPDAEMEINIRDDRDEEAESLIRWAAARAGLIVVAPVLGTAALMANEVYMIVRMGKIYGIRMSDRMVLSFIGSLGGKVAGNLAATLIPVAFMQVPIAVSVTYGIGRAAQRWIKDGMPDDVKPYRDVFEQEKKAGEADLEALKDNPMKDQPLGDESVDFNEKAERACCCDKAHAAFRKVSDRLAETAESAATQVVGALKKAGVREEQLEDVKYMAIGVSEAARETAEEAARDLSAHAKETSKVLAEEAKARSKEFSARAKEEMEAARKAGRKLRREADVRVAEARVKTEQARAEARVRMAQARVKAVQMRAQAETQAEEAKARAEAAHERVQNKMKEVKETARQAAEDFRALAKERAGERRAADYALRGEALPAGEGTEPAKDEPRE